MQSCVKNIPQWGRVLWLSDGSTDVGVALEFGLRIVHLSCTGQENLFYEQPNDLSDGFVTDKGWRLYGGHRLWLAPEGDATYCPDNAPIQYSLEENGVLLAQEIDPLLMIRKQIRITYLDDGSIALEHIIENVSDHKISGSCWGVNTLDAGGVAVVNFSCMKRGGYTPQRIVSLWSDTNLHDPRLCFAKDCLTARHKPLDDYLKIGLYSNPGKATYENKGQKLTITFDAAPINSYPDNGCNFELYMCRRFMEMETLGCKTEILPGESMRHIETWYVTKL